MVALILSIIILIILLVIALWCKFIIITLSASDVLVFNLRDGQSIKIYGQCTTTSGKTRMSVTPTISNSMAIISCNDVIKNNNIIGFISYTGLVLIY